MPFVKAIKYQHKLRVGLAGPTGSGKTFTALSIGCPIALREGGRVALIDSEHGTAKLYAERFDFDHLELTSFAPDRYVEAIHEAEREGYAVIIVDSATHAWNGKDGALEQVDKKASQGGNSFTAWRDVTPQHNRLVESMVGCKTHIIVTVRSKMAYALQEVEDHGRKRTVVEKLGLQPVQREGMEYEFDVFADLDVGNVLTISKTRCEALQGYSVLKAGEEIANTLFDWAQGAPEPPKPVAEQKPTSEKAALPASQLGDFGTPEGRINGKEFLAYLTDQGLTTGDLQGLVPLNAAGGGDLHGYLQQNPEKTLMTLVEEAKKAKATKNGAQPALVS